MKSNVPVKYSIKKTDKDLLLKWYHLLFLGRSLDELPPTT